MKDLYLIRKRRFDELVEFDKRILDENKKWQYYDKNPDAWKTNVVAAAALLGAAAMDTMAGEDELAPEEGYAEDE